MQTRPSQNALEYVSWIWRKGKYRKADKIPAFVKYAKGRRKAKIKAKPWCRRLAGSRQRHLFELYATPDVGIISD